MVTTPDRCAEVYYDFANEILRGELDAPDDDHVQRSC